jgi:hypothetical protein
VDGWITNQWRAGPSISVQRSAFSYQRVAQTGEGSSSSRSLL